MKKVIAMLLASLMLVSLAACKTAEKPADGGEDTAAAPETLKIWFHGSNVTDDSAVLEAANAYLAEKGINATIQPIWGTWGDFDENVVTAINGFDDVDMYFTCSWSSDEYMSYAKKGAWVRLDNPDNDLLAQYGQDMKKAIPDALWKAATVEGTEGIGIYAVPGNKDFAVQNCWDVNVTALEELGYTLEDVESRDFYSFGDLFEAYKKANPDKYPFCIEGAVLERMVTNSIVVTGDAGSVNLLSYYVNPEDPSKEGAYGNKVVNKFGTEEYKKFIAQVKEYYDAGYIDPQMAIADTANDARTTTQLAGAYLIGTQSYSLGYELQASEERGIHVEFVGTTPAYCDTTAAQGAMIAVSSASKNPELAVQFLNLLNSDPYFFTLMDYGVEGIHYELKDGLVEFTDERANYTPWTNGMGNVTLLTPTVAQGADFWDTWNDYYSNAAAIPCLGWAFDASEVETEQAALVGVAGKYAHALSTGSAVGDLDEVYEAFLAELDAAGMQAYVDAANAQLDAFFA
jgi:putative aldouronate transport system substrate-binding protein